MLKILQHVCFWHCRMPNSNRLNLLAIIIQNAYKVLVAFHFQHIRSHWQTISRYINCKETNI